MIALAQAPNTSALAATEATLLLVDDDEHVRRALKRVLKRATNTPAKLWF